MKFAKAWAGLVLVIAVLLWGWSCGSNLTATPTRQPSPTPFARAIIEKASERMLALDTASFTLTHEGGGSTQLFLGIDLKQVKGQVDMPDKFRINVEAVSSLPRSFVEVDIVAVRDQAYMTDIIHRDKWLLIELSALPFNFADLGRTLSGIVQSLQAPRIDGSDTVNGVPSWRVVGTVSSESLDTLVTAAEEGYRVALEVWIGQPQGLLRKVRIKGQILSTDLPDLVRVLTIHGFDQPVEITIPSISD